MSHKNRTPHPMCPLSDCMAFIGGAWTPNILWHLAQGPRRFSELRADMPLVSAKVLTQRLRELEERLQALDAETFPGEASEAAEAPGRTAEPESAEPESGADEDQPEKK